MGKHVNLDLKINKLVDVTNKEYIFDIDKELKKRSFH